jgi:hypothetical protein
MPLSGGGLTGGEGARSPGRMRAGARQAAMLGERRSGACWCFSYEYFNIFYFQNYPLVILFFQEIV